MRNLEDESDHRPLWSFFDRRMKLEVHGSRVTSDAGLLAYRKLDDALGLTALAGGVIADSRTGRNGWHAVDRRGKLEWGQNSKPILLIPESHPAMRRR